MNTYETIAAIAGGIGGAISIVRISGAKAYAIAQRVMAPPRPLNGPFARKMRLANLVMPEAAETAVDQALFVYMPGPASYTGEDIVEIQGHGGNQAAQAALRAVLQAGARLAEPGEFTFRAFVNGKMDLTQAEAVADMINATNVGALHLAERQLEGHLGEAVQQLRHQLIEELAELESRLDFPEEQLNWSSTDETRAHFRRLADAVEALATTEQSGRIWREGVQLVLAGRPNSGKSSLMNYLLGRDRAIVTDIAGTTRDTLEESVILAGVPFVLTDTAGIRNTENPVEVIGIERSRRAVRSAQVILWLLDAAGDVAEEAAGLIENASDPQRTIAVWNKVDRAPAGVADLPALPVPAVGISALTGAGIPALIETLLARVRKDSGEHEPEIAVNTRHAEALRQTRELLREADEPLAREDWEVAAVFLHQAVKTLGSVTGETADPDLLENIFSRFCLGK